MNDDEATQTGAEEIAQGFTPAWKSRAEAMEAIAAEVAAKNAEHLAPVDQPEKKTQDAALTIEPTLEQPKNELAQVANSTEQTNTGLTATEHPAPKLRTIVVDGQRIEVDEAKIIEQGIRTLQKETAADQRLAKANLLLKRVQSGDYVGQEVERDETPAPSQPGYLDPRTLKEVVGNLVREETQAVRAVDTFKAEFPEIASDPMLMRLAIDREDQRLAHALSVGDNSPPSADVFRAHGNAIREWVKKMQPAQTSAQEASASADNKLERKRTATVVQSASVRAVTQNKTDRPPTVNEMIEEERRARRGRPAPSASRRF